MKTKAAGAAVSRKTASCIRLSRETLFNLDYASSAIITSTDWQYLYLWRNARAYFPPFDNLNGLSTGVAITNLSNQTATVPVTVRGGDAAIIASGTVVLDPQGHKSFTLTDTDRFPAAANTRGVVEFGTPLGGQIAILGIRAAPGAAGMAITTIPVIAKP